MRRLVRLVSILVFVDTMLFAALTPLLGHFARALALSPAGAGALVASYAAGVLLGGLPGGAAAAHMGPRRAVLTGLVLMGAASLGFAWSASFLALALSRLLQGIGSGFTWAGSFSWLLASSPREQRGAVIGRAMGAAVFGALFGPVVGAAAAELGRSVVFSAIAALAGGLAVLTLRIPSRPPEQPSLAALRRSFTNRSFIAGLGLLTLASLLTGVVSVLAPLKLTADGWGPSAVGAVWLVAAAIEGCQSPAIGRLSDRRGPLTPVRFGLAAATAASLILVFDLAAFPYALAIVLASVVYGVLFTPAFTLISEGAEQAGLAQGMGFGLMNASWALGAMAGPAGAGALAGAAGQRLPYVLVALACAATLTLIGPRARLAAPATGT